MELRGSMEGGRGSLDCSVRRKSLLKPWKQNPESPVALSAYYRLLMGVIPKIDDDHNWYMSSIDIAD